MAQYLGIYRGVVVNVADPGSQGRVQIRLPSMAMATQWAFVCTAAGAPRNSVPQIGGDVVVAFEGGDPDHPIVLGMIQG